MSLGPYALTGSVGTRVNVVPSVLVHNAGTVLPFGAKIAPPTYQWPAQAAVVRTRSRPRGSFGRSTCCHDKCATGPDATLPEAAAPVGALWFGAVLSAVHAPSASIATASVPAASISAPPAIRARVRAGVRAAD